ncbi:MAG: hypothetical protein HY849_05330 [Nitrosomonadales bacterium]|nr:hypothetical protein [Nitrosomonadales bacterium]
MDNYQITFNGSFWLVFRSNQRANRFELTRYTTERAAREALEALSSHN